MSVFSRVRWFRALLLVTGGWLCTAFLIVLLLEQRQQYADRSYILQALAHVPSESESNKLPCDCSCGNATTSAKVTGASQKSENETKSAGNQTHRRSVIGQDVANGVPSYFVQPKPTQEVWPRLNETNDRVLAQMNLLPESKRIQRIALWGRFAQIKYGKTQFIIDACPVQDCEIVSKEEQNSADVVVFERDIEKGRKTWRDDQILVWYMLESPMNGPKVPRDTFNWTATYRRDSTINTPYERFTFYRNFSGTLPSPARNYSQGKSKMAAWFVSNCNSQNGRQTYVKELQKYIDVDIYGGCGDKQCPRKSRLCPEMLSKDYKFYLAFENSNCVDYITEKFYWNGLLNDVVPVVMGARPEDYAAVAPPHSYIHVDDFESPRDLADHLRMLNSDHQKYNEYFRWKGTGEFINTKFWCRLCSLAHEAATTDTRLHYRDFQKWWSGDGVCLQPDEQKPWLSWRHQPRTYQYVQDDTLQYIT